MPRYRLPNLLTKYEQKGTRNQGRPLKTLLDEQASNGLFTLKRDDGGDDDEQQKRRMKD
jgi:hypothetical protein